VSKTDNLFLRIINDEQLVATFDIDPSRYTCIEDGRESDHPQVHAIAEIISLMSRKINDTKSEMRIRQKTGPVVFDESDYQPIYKKVVSMLSK
jgi:hypothetical protein